jgi:hypothetical protein
METLPDLVHYKIAKYLYEDVLHKIEYSNKAGPAMWENPSERLCNLSKNDIGAIQKGHELDQFVQDHNLDLVHINCLNCKEYNFPCLNCHLYVYEEYIPCQLWKIS